MQSDFQARASQFQTDSFTAELVAAGDERMRPSTSRGFARQKEIPGEIGGIPKQWFAFGDPAMAGVFAPVKVEPDERTRKGFNPVLNTVLSIALYIEPNEEPLLYISQCAFVPFPSSNARVCACSRD
jgi:hypothetical protein